MAEQTASSGKRDRSPKFPYVGLAKALNRIEVLYEKAKRYDARVADIASDWGLSPKSSSTDRTVAALQSFGLIEDSDSGENRKIKLSELGARILIDQRPGIRDGLLAEAAVKPPIISEYAKKWREGRPDDTHALSQLQFEGGFTEDGAKMFLRVFDETIRFTKSNEPASVADNGGDSDRDSLVVETDNNFDPPTTDRNPRRERREINAGMKEDVFSLSEGDVTLQWPASLSAESYEDLEDWTKLILRKIKRSVDTPKPLESSQK